MPRDAEVKRLSLINIWFTMARKLALLVRYPAERTASAMSPTPIGLLERPSTVSIMALRLFALRARPRPRPLRPAMAPRPVPPSVPPAVLQQQAKTAEEQKHPNKHPTTQELLSGKRSRTALIPLPLTMELPPGWGKLNDVSDAGLKLNAGNLLQGYTPNGEVQIQLSARPALKKEDLDRMLAAGKKELAEKPQQIVKFELRPLGTNQVLERQSVG